MALVNMQDMLYHAYENKYAVGAFDLVSLDFLEAVIEAAENCRAPVILSLAEPYFCHFDFELMMAAVEAAAKRAAVPVAIQLDHGGSLHTAVRAIQLGCNSVMLDASGLELRENIKLTRDVVGMAHGCGVPVVGEVGYVAGQEGEGAQLHPGEMTLTNPAEAKCFVEQTGVDFLAISIGTIQGRSKGRTKLDFQRLKKLNQSVNIPLVIHGGSGLSDEQFRKLPTLGVAKINYYTALSDAAAKAMRRQIRQNPAGSFIDLKKGVKEAIGEEVERCLKLWGSSGRAAEVLGQSAPWREVEQLIVHNVFSAEQQNVDRLMREGKAQLQQIAGVRCVFCGQALRAEDRYQFSWRIRFASEKVLQGFYQTPQYLHFKNTLFNHFAADSLSINYRDHSDDE